MYNCRCGAPVLPPQRKWCSDACRDKHRSDPARRRHNRDATRVRNRATTRAERGGRSIPGRLARPFWDVDQLPIDPEHRFLSATLGLETLPREQVNVAWGLNRVVTTWLQDLEHEYLEELLDRQSRVDPEKPWVIPWWHFCGWHIDWLPGKWFKIRRGQDGPITSVWEVSRMLRTKDRPDDLAAAMEQVKAECVWAEVIPRDWSGPGRGASVILNEGKVKEYLAPLPEGELARAVSMSFSGHRFELTTPGWHSRLWSYDLTAAYPWAVTTLPCFGHGRWVHGDLRPPRGYGDYPWVLREVTWDLKAWKRSQPFGPFLFRTPAGTALFPAYGCNWVWGPEFEVAMRHWGDSIVVRDAWSFIPGCDHRPWDFLLPYLERRQQHPILKKFLNSAAGKTMQSHPSPGYWFDPITAGAMTSVVRGRMLAAALAAGTSAICITGDCLWATRDVKNLPGAYGTEPGQWRRKEHRDVTFVKAEISYEGSRITAAAGTPAAALDGLRDHFAAAWAVQGLAGHIEVPYRHHVGIPEAAGAGWSVAPGDILDLVQRVSYNPGIRREAPAGTPHPPPTAVLTRIPSVSDLSVQSVYGEPLSTPYWDANWRPIANVPEWPTEMDEIPNFPAIGARNEVVIGE